MVTLSTRYATAKAKLKRMIQENMEQWIAIGEQLRQIKESGDWKQDCSSWAEFCRNCCAFSKRFADQLIADTKAWIPLKEVLSEMGTVFPPFTQLAVREIAQIENPQERLEIAHEVARNGSKPVTPKAVRAITQKRAKAKVIDAATGQPEAQNEPITIRIPFTADEWRRIMRGVESLKDMEIEPVFRGHLARAGVSTL